MNGLLHRSNGPAIIYYFKNGSIEDETWYKSNMLHREGGPALIRYDRNGNIVEEKYYFNDVEIVDEFQIEVLKSLK